MNAGTVSIHPPQPGLAFNQMGSPAQGGAALTPIILYVKNVAIPTADNGPMDIATIRVPPWVKRFRLYGSSGTTNPAVLAVAESLTGTLNGGQCDFYDAPNGTGVKFNSTTLGLPATLGVSTGQSASNFNPVSTSSTIYIYLQSVSANVGTCSFYVIVLPLP